MLMPIYITASKMLPFGVIKQHDNSGEKRAPKYIILFPVANPGYQLKIQVARGNF